MSEEKPNTPYPVNDLLTNYEPQETPDKYAYLKGIYLFRYPFTLTAIKWGLALGGFFALHTFFKKRDPQQAIFWFLGGSLLTGMPLWGFFMMKYTFYSVGLRKFEEEQQQQLQEQQLIKTFYAKKVNLKFDEEDEVIAKSVKMAHRKAIEKYLFMDELLSESEMRKLQHLIDTK